MTAALGFVTKGIDTALRAQVRIRAGLEIIVVARDTGLVVARWTWAIVAWSAVVKLTWGTLTLWAIAVAWGTIAELFGAFTIAACRAFAVAVAADMAIGAGCTAFATTATAVGSLAFANALHHFAACRFGGSCHHITAWGLA